MSEPTSEATPPEATPPEAAPPEATPGEPAPIDFDKADFAEPPGEHVTCGLCKQAILTEYWQYLDKLLCDSCREVVTRSIGAAREGATFGKALLLGGLVAFGCGLGYALFVGLLKIQFALITIGIGWAVGRSIQRITRGFGTRKHQVLAVALTYFGSSMGYLPAVLSAFGDGAGSSAEGGPAATAGATDSPPGAMATGASPAGELPSVRVGEPPPPPTPAGEPAGTQAGSPPAEGPGVAVSLFLVTVVTLFIMLAAPLFDVASGLGGVIGALIIFFGLRTAWRVSKGIEGQITGPHKVAAPTEP